MSIADALSIFPKENKYYNGVDSISSILYYFCEGKTVQKDKNENHSTKYSE